MILPCRLIWVTAQATINIYTTKKRAARCYGTARICFNRSLFTGSDMSENGYTRHWSTRNLAERRIHRHLLLFPVRTHCTFQVAHRLMQSDAQWFYKVSDQYRPSSPDLATP